MNKKQRYCKTCDIEVGKGKSYCSKSCRPSAYINRYKAHQKNRKCKICEVIVGKGKSYCKECCHKKSKKFYRNQYAVLKQSGLLDDKLSYGKKYREKNKDKCRAYTKKYQKEKDVLREKEYKKIKVHCSDCDEFIGSRFELYGLTLGPKVPRCKDCKRLVHNERMREYRKKPKNRLSSDVRTRVWQTLKGGKKHKSTFDALGYTAKQLMEHLEKQFQNGMNWDNYTKFGWHIDHIKPVDAFNFTSTKDKEFKECWKLSNLQPLWAEDNWKKNNKIL